MNKGVFVLCLVAGFGVALSVGGPSSALRASAEPTSAQIEAQCRPYFGNACSEAMGRWLPRLPQSPETSSNPTMVHDEIVDPAGSSTNRFLELRGVSGGTLVVYGGAGGPPRAHVVYDLLHRIALYDDGCCSHFSVVVASESAPPPERVVERSLLGLHTAHGIHLNQPQQAIEAVFGPAHIRHSDGVTQRTTLSYKLTLHPAPPSSACVELTRFTFENDRLTAWEYDDVC